MPTTTFAATGSAVIPQDKIIPAVCRHCGQNKEPKDAWWCRDCALTLCSSCNLLKGHTEHRCTPWNRTEIAQSCIRTLQERCTLRTNQAAEEELAIKEYLAEIEVFFLNKLQERLRELNEKDRAQIATLIDSFSLDRTHVNFAMSSLSSGTGGSPISKAHANVASHIDHKLVKHMRELARFGYQTDESIVDGSLKGVPITPPSDGRDSRSSSIRAQSPVFRRRYFALPEISVDEFAQVLEQKLNVQLGSDSVDASFDNSAFVPDKVSTPTRQSIFQASADTSAHGLANGLNNGNSRRSSANIPIEPTVHIINGDQQRRVGVDRSASSSSVPLRTMLATATDNVAGVPPNKRSSDTVGSTVQLLISANTQTADSTLEKLTNATQTDLLYTVNAVSFSAPITPVLPRVSHAIGSGERDNVSVGTTDSTNTLGATRYAITGFHFGQDYFTRPIDVACLPDRRLAVSDSCAGVYVTSLEGEVLQNIWTDEGSASSLFYNGHRFELLVSVLRKDNSRAVQVYNAADRFQLTDVILCPHEPSIEVTRTRWIASTKGGDIFAVSGDNHNSAVWKYSVAQRGWVLLKQSRMTRLQYVCLIEDRPEKDAVTLLTCDGVTGTILMLLVGPNGRIVRDYDLTKQWGLEHVVKSPASALYDRHGNVLILDYMTGKLWLLAPAAANQQRQSPSLTKRMRRLSSGSKQQMAGAAVGMLRCLADLGPQRAIGMAVSSDGWCYVASFARRRVQAVKYLDVGD